MCAMAFKYREEIVGKRFLSVSGPGKLKLFRISEWEWRSGVIRAVSHTDTKSPDLAVLVEFDDIDWTRREWIRVQDQGNFQVFLVENTLVWAQRRDPFRDKNTCVYWPALNFKPIVDKVGLREHRVKPVEFLVDKNLAFVDDSSLKVYQDLDESNQLASKEYSEVRKAVKSWIEYQDGQSILLTTPSVLVGYRVEVYRSEGTTQWYTAVIVSYNHVTRELTVTDDTVLEEHNEDPGLVQMKLIGDGVVDSILRGEKVGITPRRRTCTLQNPNNSIGHYSTRTRSQNPSHSTRSQVLGVSRKQRQTQPSQVETPVGIPLPELEKAVEKPSSRLRSQRERKRKINELEIAIIEEKKIVSKRIKSKDIAEIKDIEVKNIVQEITAIKEKAKNKKQKNIVICPIEKVCTDRRDEKRKTRLIDKPKIDSKEEEENIPVIQKSSPSPTSYHNNTDSVSVEILDNKPCVSSISEPVEEKSEPEPVPLPVPKIEPVVENSENSTVIKCGRNSPTKNDLETAISQQQKRTTTNNNNTVTNPIPVETKQSKSRPLLVQTQNSRVIEQALSRPKSHSVIKSAADDRLPTTVPVAQIQSKVNEERSILKISNEEQSAFKAVEDKTATIRTTEIKRSKTSPSASPLVFDKNEPVKVWRDPNLLNADIEVRHITSLQHTTMHGHHAAAAAANHSSVYAGVPNQPSHTAIGHPSMSSPHTVSQHSRSILPPIHYGQHPGPSLANPHMLPHLEQHAALARGLPYASVLPQAAAHMLSPYIHNDLLWSQKYGPMSLASSQWMIIQNQEGLVAREQERVLLQEQERKDRERLEREQKEQLQRERELAERQRDSTDRTRQEREHSERDQVERLERSRERESLHITSQHIEDPFRIAGQKKPNSPWNPIISNNPRISQSRISSNLETGSPANTSHLDKTRDQSQNSGPLDRVKLEAVERKRVGTPAGEDHIRRTQELLLVQQEEEKKLLALQQAEMIKQQRQHEKEEEALKLQQLQHEKDQRAALKQASYSYKQSESNNRPNQDSSRSYKVDFPYSHIPPAAYSGPLYTTNKASPLTLGMAAHRIKQEPNFNLYGYQPFQHSYIAQDKLPVSTQAKTQTPVSLEQPKTSYPTSITQTVSSSTVKKNLPSPPHLVHPTDSKQGHSVIVSTTSPGLTVVTNKESETHKSLTNNRDNKGALPMSPKQQLKLYQQDRSTPVSLGNPPPLSSSSTVTSRNNYASFKPYDMSFSGSRSSPLQSSSQPLDLQRIPKPTVSTPPTPSPSPKNAALNSGLSAPSVIVSTTNSVHTNVSDTSSVVSQTSHTTSWAANSTVPSRNSIPHTIPAHTSPVWTSATTQSTIPSWTSTTSLSCTLIPTTHTSNAVYTEATAASKVVATCASVSSGLNTNRPSPVTTTTAFTHTNIAQPAVLFSSINSSTQPVTSNTTNQSVNNNPSQKRKPPKESSNRKKQKNETNIPQSSTPLPSTTNSSQFSTATTTVISVTTTVTVSSTATTTTMTTSSSNIQLAAANRNTGFIDSFKSFVQSSAQLSQQEHFFSKHAKGRHKTRALPNTQPPNHPLSNSASTSGSESTRVSNGMADSDSDTVGTASSPPLNRDTNASPGKTNNPPKLKKAWLQRHSDEDKKEASKKQTEVFWQAKSVDSQQNQQILSQSATPSQPKESKPTHSYSTRLVNGHVGETHKTSHLDDSTSSASETETEMVKRKVKTKRRKTSAAANKRSKNNSESDGLVEEKLSKKEEKMKQEIKAEPVNLQKPVPKKRGRKPKDLSKTVSGRPLVKPSIAKLKKTGEPFLQDGPCCEMTPKLSKCRECRLTPHQRNKKMPNIFCRFYAFRRLRYSKTGLLAKAGFSDPEHADSEDLQPWLPQFNARARELDVQTSIYILLNVADQFCELVRQECEAQSWAGNEVKVAWKRAVQGVREMCDVCETTLFNIHWVCHKCGFVVCLDCYRARIKCPIKDEEALSRDRDEYNWLLCHLRRPHEAEKLMLTQMIPSSALWELGQMLTLVRKEWNIPSMGIYDKLFKFSTSNGVFQLLNAVEVSSDRSEKNAVNGEKEESRNRLNGSVCCHLKNDLSLGSYNSENESPLNWLADLALNSSGKLEDFKSEDYKYSLEKVKEKLENTEITSDFYSEFSSDSESDQQDGKSTLRKLLVRPNSKAAREREKYLKAKHQNNIDLIIASVIQRSGKKAEKENCQSTRKLLHYIPKHSSPVTIPEPLPIRIHTLTETSFLYPDVPHSWLCDGRLLRLHDPSNKGNFRLFQEQWKRGQPVLVSDVHKRLHSELWKPQAFSKEFGELKNDLVNCRTGAIIQNIPMRTFWDGFENLSNRLRDETNELMLLKLKDWPPGDDFSEMLPARFHDLMQALPLPEYTQRNGKLNLASRLPDFFVRPDLGPKMYNAYGSAAFPSEGTTNLHLDISDAVNVMVHVGVPEGSEAQDFEEALKAIDDASCDIITKRRVREVHERPGALWHIYASKDANKIRDLLNKVAIERGEKLEPHHDPIHDQSWYLDGELRERLYNEYGVVGYAIAQCLGDAVFIPAGAPHQVRNLHSCIKVAEDFVSPEHVGHCFKLTHEFRDLSDTHTNHEDKLQVKNIIYHAVKDAVAVLRCTSNQNKMFLEAPRQH